MRSTYLFAGLLLALVATASAAQTFRSPEQQASLVELYTSEGCSSCPPADRWLSRLLRHPELWSTVIPIALHVDYWDELGWEDRFAQSAFTTRQRRYRLQGSVGGVYTPGVLAAGQEWRSWRSREFEVPLTQRVVGVLELRREGEAFEADFAAASGFEDGALDLHVAVLGFGLQSRVRAGENSGRVLSHDFVVLAHHRHAAQDLRWASALPVISDDAGADRLGLVAWVSPTGRQEPLQAVGGWLD